MQALDGVRGYMEFWGWTNGGNPGSVKHDLESRTIARHGDATWIADVQKACDTLERIATRATLPNGER